MVKIELTAKEFVEFVAPKIREQYHLETFKECNKRGYLTFEEFLILAYSKTPRQIHNYLKNTPEIVKEITTIAFSKAKNDKDYESLFDILCTLKKLEGVDVPVASFLLSAYDPKNYGTYDFRIRDILQKCEGFKKPDKEAHKYWYKAELKLLKKWRDEIAEVDTCRQIEYTLWQYSRMTADNNRTKKLVTYLSDYIDGEKNIKPCILIKIRHILENENNHYR